MENLEHLFNCTQFIFYWLNLTKFLHTVVTAVILLKDPQVTNPLASIR